MRCRVLGDEVQVLGQFFPRDQGDGGHGVPLPVKELIENEGGGGDGVPRAGLFVALE